MIFTSKLAAYATLLSLATIPLARGVEIPVTVGGTGIIAYTPNSVTANPGDIVVFTFQQKNHTATQSTLQAPCQPLAGGFDSGFVPVAPTDTGPFPVALYTVQDTNPVWVYCRQTGHCQQGMVFAINPGTQFAAFQAAAQGGAAAPPPASAPPPATTAAPPPAASGVVTVTATVTVAGNALTTTYGSYPGSAAPTSPVSSDHQVVVGGSGLIYTPSNITAQVGDTVTFQFMQKNHTATQSTFANPCRALALTSTSGQVGFDSGFMPVAAGATSFPTFTIQINDSSPIWVYCRQATHCGQGMVFSVNAIESGPNTFDAFKAKAIQLNGTSGTSGSPSSTAPSSQPSNSASPRSVSHGAGIVVTLVAAIFCALL